MEQLSQVLLTIHIITGFCSILIFWLPMITKKGGRIHRISGEIYVYAMWIVVISAGLLCLKNLCFQSYNSALFLGFLTIITANPLWYGIAVLKFKNTPDRTYQNILLIFNVAIFLFAIFMIGYNIFVLEGKNVLMFIFGGLGLTSISEIVRKVKSLPSKRNRIQEHAIGMITTAIAAYTAFFAFGGRTLFGEFLTGHWMIVPWVLPGVLGTFANIYYGKKYASAKKETQLV